MARKTKILAVCRQSLDNVDYAVRAFCMFRHLRLIGCSVTYLDNWRPSVRPGRKNVVNLARIAWARTSPHETTFVFVENVQASLFAKIFRRIGLRLVLDVRDDLNLHAEAMGISLSDSVRIEREKAEIEWFKSAEKILVTSSGYETYYSRKHHGRFDHKLLTVMNASDPTWFRDTPLPREPRIGILGGANFNSGLDLLCQASKIVKREVPGLSLHIGYKCLPETRAFMGSLRQENAQDWVHFYEDVDYCRNANDFYSSLSLCIIPLKKMRHYELTIPSRLFDAMASARPLVVTACREQARIVTEEACGLVCGFTPEDMAEKITRVLKDPELARQMGQNGRRAVELRHNWRHRAEGILKGIRHSSGKREARP
jgi:glycosyltransferase involved in cell wall biosynthesis